MERPNKEIRLRTDAVGIFPKVGITRPIGGAPHERNDGRLLQHRYVPIEEVLELTSPLIDADPAKLPPLAT